MSIGASAGLGGLTSSRVATWLLAGLLAAEPTTAVVAEGPAPAPTVEVTPERRDPLGCDGSKSCVRLTATGIAFGGLGLAAVVGGGVLIAQPDAPLADDPTKVRSTKPVGTVMVALGAGVLVSSIVMLVASRRSKRHRSDEARPQ